MCLLPCSAFDYIANEDPLPDTVSLGVLTTQVHLSWTIVHMTIFGESQSQIVSRRRAVMSRTTTLSPVCNTWHPPCIVFKL